MYPDHPVPAYDVIIVDVYYDPRAKDAPAILTPGTPPGRIIVPAIGRNVNAILTIQEVLDWSPIVHIDKITIVPVIAASAVGIALHGFYDHFFTVEIFVSDDLQHGFPTANDLEFDHCYVLYVVTVNQCLQDNSVVIALPPVLHPDVIDPAVVVEVQVIHPVVFGIDPAFKIPEGGRLLEQIQCTFKTEIIALISSAFGTVLRLTR